VVGRAEVRLRGKGGLERFVTAEGSYGFEDLVPVDYELAAAADGETVETRPFPALAPERVKVVAGAGAIVRDLKPPALRARPVTGVVLLPGGKPVAGVEVRWGTKEAPTYVVMTEAQGRFDFVAYEGLAYDVSASGFDRRTIAQRDHVHAAVPARGKAPRIVLRIQRWDRTE
jgi:hypothetical protein